MNDVLAYTLLLKTIRNTEKAIELQANVDARVESLRASGFNESQIDAAFEKLKERNAVRVGKNDALVVNRYALQGKDLSAEFMLECVISANKYNVSIVDFMEVFGVPPQMTNSKLLKLARKNFITWGVSMERCWPTEDGLAIVEAKLNG